MDSRVFIFPTSEEATNFNLAYDMHMTEVVIAEYPKDTATRRIQ